MAARIAHIADSHFDERNALEDNLRVHLAFVEQAREADVDLIVHSGDIFHRRSSVAERNALARFLLSAGEVAPVVICRGNHDVSGDLAVFSELDTRHRIVIHERPGFVIAGGIAVHTVPWFDKAAIVAEYDIDDQLSAREATIAAARAMLDGVRTEIARPIEPPIPHVVVGHLQVAGAEVSTGQTLIGTSVELSPGDLKDTGADYVALGHIHKRQEWYDGAVSYAGSPQRHDYGETEPKSWNLVTIDRDTVDVDVVELPARRLVLVDVDLSEGASTTEVIAACPDDLARAHVRVRYTVRPQDLHLVDTDEIQRTLLNAGADRVTTDPRVIHQARVRCEDLAEARDTWERIEAYWQAKEIEVDDETRERVRAKLATIETTVAATHDEKEVAA